jgi:capsule polysaccharide export protein KpsE/RkpR
LNPEVTNHQIVENGEHTSRPTYVREEAGDSPFLASHESSFGADLLPLVWRERRFIAKAFCFGFLAAAILSLLITPTYEATTRIMPPEKQGMGGLAAMLAAAGGGEDKAGSVVGSIVSDAMGFKSSGALYVGVLHSSTVQDKLIDQFNLRKVYKVRYMKDAESRLAGNTDVNEDRKSGIISITATDTSPQRAAQLSAAYVQSLNDLMTDLNTSSAHRERVFLEERLKAVKVELDADSKALSDFSSKNLTLDVKEQGKAMLEGAATLEGQLIAAESQLSGLEQIYTPNNVRVRSLQARVEVLKQKLSQLRGGDTPPGEDTNGTGSSDFGMSISKLPALGVSYFNLYRQVKIQEIVYETLTKQYELAKVEEAKELPSIKVLDRAVVPEYKSSPKRTLITIVGAMLAGLLAMIYVMSSAKLNRISASHPLSLFGLEVREGIGEDWKMVRDRIPQPVLQAVLRLQTTVSRFTSRSAPPK